jgi:hypothetical protein
VATRFPPPVKLAQEDSVTRGTCLPQLPPALLVLLEEATRTNPPPPDSLPLHLTAARTSPLMLPQSAGQSVTLLCVRSSPLLSACFMFDEIHVRLYFHCFKGAWESEQGEGHILCWEQCRDQGSILGRREQSRHRGDFVEGCNPGEVVGGGLWRGSKQRQAVLLPPQGVPHECQDAHRHRRRHRAVLLPTMQQVNSNWVSKIGFF